MTSSNVRVRFAPSPTGYLHIGGARTALFNYLYAKRHHGTFVLRIENTDRERSTQEAVDAILDGMKWLGLTWDEGPYYQTERMDVYQPYIDQLLEEGKAYRCYCTPERLQTMREELKAQKKKPMYDRRCLAFQDEVRDEPYTLRFRVPEGETVLQDLVKGKVVVKHNEVEDLIIARADGTPTYNFVVVADDHDMKISHVIRGDDHLNNTFKQVLLYQALGFDVPKFAHLPLILGQDKTRLSKRHGATAVQMYREDGYFPHTINNFLVRLGWSHKDQEIFSMEEMIEAFDFDAVGKSPGVFNPEKLLWINQHYIKEKPFEEVLLGVEQFIDIPLTRRESPQMKQVIDLLRDRAKTLKELAQLCTFYTEDDLTIEEEDQKKFLTPEVKPYFETLVEKLQAVQSWSEGELKEAFEATLKAHDLKFKHLGQPLRIALTASRFSPGIYEILEVLGQDRSLERLKKVLSNL